MKEFPTSRTRHASPKLKSRLNEAHGLPESFWAQVEEDAVREATASPKPRRVLRLWTLAAAACLAAAVTVGFWNASSSDPACFTFACLWETQTQTPLSPEELELLDRWESTYDDALFDSTSF